MKLRKIALTAILVMVIFLSSGRGVLAQYCESKGHGAASASPWIDSALGCIPVKLDEAVVWFLPYLFGIAGGISFLLMVYGFILMTLSAGDPKAVMGAQETVTSAITGLIVSIFALFIIRLIFIGILRLPGIT